MQRVFFFLIAISTATAAMAANGVVWTLDGRRFEGEIELARESLIIKSPASSVTVPATNLAHARFSTNNATSSRGNGNGLLGIYYNTTNFTGATVMRIDPAIDFDWKDRPPIFGVPKDGFSVRWMAQLEAPSSDTYTIYFGTDDGGRIYFDDQLVADHWTPHDYAETNFTVSLKAGGKHKLKAEYFDAGGNARAQLFWSTATMPKTIVPQERFYAASWDMEHQADSSGLVGAQGLLATYYDSEDFTSNSFTRIDSEINFDWHNEGPMSGFGSNNFSVRWSGRLLAPKSGEYKFYLLGGEPSRLFINNQLLSDPLSVAPQQIMQATLDAVQPAALRLEISVTNNATPLRLYWSSDTFPQTLLSRQNLVPGAVARVEDAPHERGPKYPAGVALLSGATIAAPIENANESSIRFQGVLAKQTVPLTKVSRLYVKPLTPELVAALPTGRAGVLLKNRDFIDGDVMGIENGKLKLGSVLFGARNYDLAKDVVAVVLRGVEPAPWRCSITARDGTAMYGRSISITPTHVSIGGAEELSISPADILELACPTEMSTKR